MKIVFKFLKYAFIALIIAVFVLFFFRCSMMDDPDVMTQILPSEAMKEVYRQNGDIEAFTQLMVEGTITQDGRFYTTGLIIVPETNELIITVRYNDSTLKALGEEYELSEVFPGEEYFEYYLLDSEGNKYSPDETVTHRKWRYSYRRMRFSGVDIEKYTDLAVCMRYLGEDDPEAKPFGSVFAYHVDWSRKDYKLTSTDKALLSE
ncbi:MAG: hypothetical protein IKT70_05085 [Clostridia bacterium]|nr:hypothetical protein [Clostridia bacterium]